MSYEARPSGVFQPQVTGDWQPDTFATTLQGHAFENCDILSEVKV